MYPSPIASGTPGSGGFGGLPPGVSPLAAMFARSAPGSQMPQMAQPQFGQPQFGHPQMGQPQTQSPFGAAQGLGILNLLQQRNPALLANLQAKFPGLGAGGTPPAFGMAQFPRKSLP